jgi:hypothetical protein
MCIEIRDELDGGEPAAPTLEQFQEKWNAAFGPEMRTGERLRFRQRWNPASSAKALVSAPICMKMLRHGGTSQRRRSTKAARSK